MKAVFGDRIPLIMPLVGAAMLAGSAVQPAAEAAAQSAYPARYISDVHVIMGNSSAISCDPGYTRVNQDLNEGEGGKYIYACVWYDNNPVTAMQELYVKRYSIPNGGNAPHVTCNGNDILIDGNLNEGARSDDPQSSVGLNFCKHKQNTQGGSAMILGGGHREIFSTRPDRVLTDLNFLKFDGGNLPNCNSDACVDLGVGALGYLDVAQTYDPYCQSKFGSDWHPIFESWAFSPPDILGGPDDRKADVPAQAIRADVNAGNVAAPSIIPCGRFQVPPPPDTTPPNVAFASHPDTYTFGQDVSIACTATDPTSGLASVSCPTISGKAYTFGVGKHDFTATATDYAGNVGRASTSFIVLPTLYGLRVATVELLSPTNATQVQWLTSHLDAAKSDPLHFATHIHDYQNVLSTEAAGGSLTPVANKASQLLQMAYALPAPVSINDTDAKLQYTGAWGYYPGRPLAFKDLQNDVHAATNDGDSLSYTFSGTGVTYVSEKSDGYGKVDVFIDGQFQTTVDANAVGTHNQGGQVLFSEPNLIAGQHTLKLVKHGGAYMLVDGLLVNS